ncbi:MAG: hypothetical protein ACOYMN_08055 [Roseimicrobium sp.]
MRYDRLYPGKAKLTLDEYLARQSNGDEAKERFTKFDKDKDGFLLVKSSSRAASDAMRRVVERW